MYPPCPVPDGKPKPPQIDFDKQIIIAVFQGACPSGGYDIEIKSLTEKEDGLEVLVIETTPDPEMFQSMAETYPSHIITTGKYDGKVNFKRED